jgi:hypothetical protein
VDEEGGRPRGGWTSTKGQSGIEEVELVLPFGEPGHPFFEPWGSVSRSRGSGR